MNNKTRGVPGARWRGMTTAITFLMATAVAATGMGTALADVAQAAPVEAAQEGAPSSPTEAGQDGPSTGEQPSSDSASDSQATAGPAATSGGTPSGNDPHSGAGAAPRHSAPSASQNAPTGGAQSINGAGNDSGTMDSNAGAAGDDKIHILSLAGADCTILESNGRFGIIDSGEDNDYPDGSDPKYPWREGIETWGHDARVLGYLDSLGVNPSNLDFYVGTHAHSDHIGLADTIIYKYRPQHIYTPEYDDSYITDKTRLWDNQKVYDDMIKAANWAWAAYGASLDQHVRPGYHDRITLGDMDIRIVPFDPDESYKRTGVYDANLIGYGVKATAFGASAFISADLETTNGVGDRVADRVGRVNVLKSPHHGLPNGSNEHMLNVFHPDYFVQTGYDFYMPDPIALQVQSMGAKWYPANKMWDQSYNSFIGVFNRGRVDEASGLSGLSFAHAYPWTSPHARWFTGGVAGVGSGWWKSWYGDWYYFNSSHVCLENGWVSSGGYWYYMGSDGKMATGWAKDGSTWYYMDAAGRMQSGGWKWIDGNWYYLHASGAAAMGWLLNGGKWYYMDPTSAKMATGWANDGSNWYYMDSSGAMQSGGWHWLGSYWYYLHGNGKMATGWLLVNGNWYWMNSAGQMVTGTVLADGRWSRFASSGRWLGYA